MEYVMKMGLQNNSQDSSSTDEDQEEEKEEDGEGQEEDQDQLNTRKEYSKGRLYLPCA